MPQALGAIALGLFYAGAPLGISNALVGLAGFLGTGLGQLALAAGAIGLQMALAKKAQQASSTPSDVQTNIKQEIFARRRIYGRTLTGSGIVFGFRRGEKSYLLHYICEGPIKSYVSFRLDKKPVTLDANGCVQEEQYVVDGRSRVQILTTLGTMGDEPFAALLAAFPELDTPATPFRQRGCAMVLQIVEQVAAEKLQDTYPNNMPSLQVVIDGCNTVHDARTGADGFSDNAGACLLTEIMAVYELAPDDADEIDFDSFAAFATHSDELVGRRDGSTEKRWRCAGVIQLDGENEARIRAIADICNADVYMDRQGRIAVRQKMRAGAGIALRAKNGDHLSVQIEGGRGYQKLFNAAKVTYVDPALNWKSNEVVWRHLGLIEEDGEEYSDAVSATMCPSAGQAQRLGKLAVHLANPDFSGSLTCGPQALDLMENAVFTLDLSPEDDFEREAMGGDLEYDAQNMVVSTGFTVFRTDALAWHPATDEQDQVAIPPDLPSYVDDALLNVTAAVELQANSAPILKFSWVAAGAGVLPDSYSQEVHVSAADAEDWSAATVTQSQHTAVFGAVADGGSYDWRIRNIANGKTFDWQYSTAPVTVVVDTVAPAALAAFSASDGAGQFVANFGTENDSHLAKVAIYKVPAGAALNPSIHEVRRYAVAPGISYALPLTSPAGSFDIYARPFNVSGIPGPLSGPDGAIVS